MNTEDAGWPLLLLAGIALALGILIMAGCATPQHFEDGTRASISTVPCNGDNCGKLPDGF
jgi:hypothetical protein